MVQYQSASAPRHLESEEPHLKQWKDRAPGLAVCLALAVPCWLLGKALPVVGGIISDAAAALVAGAGVLRAAVGALGAAVVLGVCLAPFLALGLRYLLYKAAAALASAFAGGRVGALISDVGSGFALVLGVTGAAAAMLFVSIISFVRAVGL